MNSKDFIFVYDQRLAKYLKLNLGICFITNAKQKDSDREFWLFPRTREVKLGIKSWKETMRK